MLFRPFNISLLKRVSVPLWLPPPPRLHVTSHRDLTTSRGVMMSMNAANTQVAFLPFWKAGSGHYGNTLGKVNEAAVSSAEPLILSLLDTIPVTQGQVFTIGDYGTNDGYTSLALFGKVISKLRERYGEGLPIKMVYEDQERNDFNSLFHHLSDETSYMSKFNNVFPMATNVNFYKQCVPGGSCDLIFSSCAVHWLQRMETRFQDTFCHPLASPEEQASVRAEAERDWVHFLTLRARELKPGGLLVLANLSACDVPTSPEGEITRHQLSQRGSNSLVTDGRMDLVDYTASEHGVTVIDIFYDVNAALRQLLKEGVITQTEYEACNLPLALRTREEQVAVFEADQSPVREAGLTLVHFDQVIKRDFFKHLWLKKLQEEDVDDRDYFARKLVEANRIWGESTFRASLSDMRSGEEKDAILDNLYQRVVERVADKDPRSYKSDIIVSRLVARKK